MNRGRVKGSKNGEMSEQEDLFLEAYLSNGYNRKEAVISAGFKAANPSEYGAKILAREHVHAEMTKRMAAKKTKFAISEHDIMEGLYKEATLEKRDGGTQQGRIQAWVSLGKQLGMFSDRNKELERMAATKGNSIQIINYNTGEKPLGTTISGEKIVKETEKAVKKITKGLSSTVEGVTLENYSKDKEDE